MLLRHPRDYALRLLKRASMNTSDLLNVYRRSVRSIPEYAVNVWQKYP